MRSVGEAKKGALPGEGRFRLARRAWIVWAAFLFSAMGYAQPFLLEDALSGLYLHVALGFAVGSWAGVAFARRPLRFYWLRRSVFPLALAGAAGSLALAGQELSVLLAYLGGGWDGMWGMSRMMPPLSEGWLNICFSACSAICAFSGMLLIDPEEWVLSSDPAWQRAHRRQEGAGVPFPLIGIALLAWMLLVGFVRCALFAPFAFYFGIGADPMSMVAPPPFALAPFALSLLIAWFAARVLLLGMGAHWRAGGPGGKRFYAASLMTAAALGMLIWNMLTRVVPVAGKAQLDFLAVDVGILCAVMGAGAVLAWAPLRARKAAAACESAAVEPAAEEAPAEADAPSNRRAAQCEALSGYGFTDREKAALACFLEGMSSSETAAALGIGPSTVRTYLQRAYKKAGVANADELRKALAEVAPEGDAPDPALDAKVEGAPPSAAGEVLRAEEAPRAEEVPRREEGESRSFASCGGALHVGLSLGGLLGLLALGFMPWWISYGGWGIGRELLMGGSAAFIVVGAAALFLQWARRRGLRGLGFGAHAAAGLVPLAALCASGLVAGRFLFAVSLGVLPQDAATAFAFSLSSFALGALWCLALLRLAAALRARRVRFLSCAAPAAACFCGVLALSLASRHMWATALLLSLAAACLAFFVREPARPPEEREGKADCQPAWGGILVFAALGFSCEEAWRLLGSFSFSAEACLFLAVLVASSTVLLLRNGLLPRLAGAGCLALLLALLCFGLGYRAVLVVAVCQSALVVAYGASRGIFGAGHLAQWIAAAGFGCAAGVVGVDLSGDVLMWNPALLHPLGGLDVVHDRMIMLLGSFCAVASGAALLMHLRLHGDLQAQRMAEGWRLGADERLRHYLLGRGLNGTQASVLEKVAQGRSSAQISEDLNYARGTINSARDAGYRALGVRTRNQLIELLRRDAGL